MTLRTEFSPRDFRTVVGLFTTGIAVVTTRIGDEISGMTVNSFTSVSLDPPLVLICVEKDGTLIERFEKTREFSVSFLTAEQEAHSRRFAKQEGGDTLVEPIFWGDGPPFVHNALGGIQCVIHQEIEAGDHIIVLGRVTGVWQSEEGRGALLYCRGRYQQVFF